MPLTQWQAKLYVLVQCILQAGLIPSRFINYEGYNEFNVHIQNASQYFDDNCTYIITLKLTNYMSNKSLFIGICLSDYTVSQSILINDRIHSLASCNEINEYSSLINGK